MRIRIALWLSVALIMAISGCTGDGSGARTGPQGAAERTAGPPAGWGDSATWDRPAKAGIDASMFVSGVTNPYWPLAPGSAWHYESRSDEGSETIDVVVTGKTKLVMGITCVVVRDTVRVNGELIEDTYDFYAQDRDGNVWYMGEESMEYEDGKAVSSAGSWEAGVSGAAPGIKVWATPRVGMSAYYQEYFKGEAEDLGRDVGLNGVAETPSGDYADLLVVEEWTPLEPEVIERKYYARGIGTVKEEAVRGGDEVVLLTRYELP